MLYSEANYMINTDKDFLSISDALPTVCEMLNEGAVLLKNDNRALPIKTGESIAIFGEGQVDAYNGRVSTLTKQRGYIPFGAGSSKAYADGKLIAPLNALRKVEANRLIHIYEPLSREYEKNVDYIPDDEMISKAATVSKTAVVFISRWVGECRDMSPNDWNLSDSEKRLLQSVCSAFEKVVVILNTGGPIDTAWAHGEVEGIDVDALLFIGYGGMAGGYAVSSILTGEANPSGKLSTTFAKKLSDYPSHGHYGDVVVEYVEDIYLGYRHFDTFAPECVSFEFGYGLSYTDFDINVTSFEENGKNVTLCVQVKNTGNTAGKEVVQVYFSSPSKQKGTAKLDAAAHELCAFKKTGIILPGECEQMTISFPIERMRRYDENGVTGYASAFVLESGEYGIHVGNSLSDAGARLAGIVTVSETVVTEQLSRRFVPVDIKEKCEETEVDSDTSTISEEDHYDITVECDGYTEIGASDEENAPKIESFNGYLFDAKSSKWITYDGSCLSNMSTDGAYAIYEFDAPKTGSYKMFLRLASHSYDETYKLYYSDDNTNFSPLSINVSIPNTFETSDGISKYFAFMDFACGVLTLREGKNYIKFEHSINLSPNLSLIRFSAIEDEKTTNDTDENVIRFADVLDRRATIQDYVAQMSDYELAEFFVAYTGKLSSEAGGSDALCEKYGHRRMNMTDGPAGVRENASSWPCETIVASSWNTELVKEMGVIIGKETKQGGYDLLLAPGLNLHRYPLCGRNNEYYSEDAYLTGVLAAAMVNGVQSTGTGACVKHFICNEQEKDKLASNSILSERSLREIYLYAFEIAIKTSDPLAIMTSYNHLNGKPASASDDLLIHVLRGEWGYDCMITGDWNNDKDIVDEINNGNGVRQPAAFCNIDTVYAAINNGKISRATLVAGAENLIRSICRMYSDTLSRI